MIYRRPFQYFSRDKTNDPLFPCQISEGLDNINVEESQNKDNDGGLEDEFGDFEESWPNAIEKAQEEKRGEFGDFEESWPNAIEKAQEEKEDIYPNNEKIGTREEVGIIDKNGGHTNKMADNNSAEVSL
jgi:hypothetical protein